MKKLVLCVVAVLATTAAILGGYYGLRHIAMHEPEVPGIGQREADEEELEATEPERAARWRADAWRDENGVVYTDGLANAVAQRDAYLAQHNPLDGFGDNGTALMNWLPIGPANVGGRTRSLVFNRFPPFVAPVMWAGAVSGGIWRSSDYGQTWSAMNGGLQNFAVNCMVAQQSLNPRQPPTLWAGTGEGFVTHGLAGGGLFTSIDGGLTWTAIEQSVTRKWQYVDSLASTRWFNPTTQQYETVMLAGVESNNLSFPNEKGILRSTDGGTIWAPVEPGNPAVKGFTSFSIIVDPNDPGHIIADLRSPNVNPNSNRIIYSRDAGAHWSTAKRNGVPIETNGAARIFKLLFFKGNSSIVYAQAVSEAPSVLSTIYKSVDGGENFDIQLGGVPTYSDYKSLFWVSPTNTSLMIAGGTDLYRSTDEGGNFDRIAGIVTIGDEPHSDSQNAVNSPGYSDMHREVYVMNDGGIYKTSDIAAEPTPVWQQLNSTYQTGQFYSAAGDAGIVSGGAQDQGVSRLLVGNPNAVQWLSGDGGGSAVAGTYCYGQGNGGLYRNSNCGSPNPQVAYLGYNLPDFVLFNPIAVPWIAAMRIDQTNPDRLFFGGSSVWRSDNVRATSQFDVAWTEIKANPTMTASPSGSPYKPVQITAMDVVPTHPEIMWVAETETGSFGRLYKTANATASPGPAVTWTPVEDNITLNQLPDRNISKILIDPRDPIFKTVYVALGTGHIDAEKSLFKTIDGGTTWRDITGDDNACSNTPSAFGLPCVPVNGIALDPNQVAHPGKMYIGTDIGIYATENVNARDIEWRPVTNGPANVKVSDLSFIKGTNKLLAATYGRGLWVVDLTGTRINPNSAANDFDGDGRSDIAVVREDGSDLVWHKDGTTEGYSSAEFGAAGDQIAPADYDGDGKVDMAFYRPSETKWYSLMSSTNTVAMTTLANVEGLTTSADFDGDGMDDEGIFDTTTGDWHVEQSANGHLDFHWGALGDTPVSVDFNGDGAADFGVFREADGMQTLHYLDAGVEHEQQFGLEGDIPVSGDYDGDAKADIAFWRPDDDGDGNGCWYITYAANEFVGYDSIPWGLSGDVPVPGDYDGDGKMDVAIWRPADGMWHILESSNGYYSQLFGADGDTPVGRKAGTYASRPGSGGFQKAPESANPPRRGHDPVRLPVKTRKR